MKIPGCVLDIEDASSADLRAEIWVGQVTNRKIAHISILTSAFCVHSSKVAWQDRSSRERKSVLSVLGIEKQPSC